MTNPVEQMAEIIETIAIFLAHESEEHGGYAWGSLAHYTQVCYIREAERLKNTLSKAGYRPESERVPPELTVLTDEDIEAVKLSDEEYEKLLSDMENYQPKEFKGAYFNAEKEKIIKHKIAQAQLDHTKKDMEE